ncbi:hypothetical protein, partial [Histophilus somni]
ISAQIQSKRVEKMFFQQLQEIEIKELPWVQEIKHLRFLAKKLEGERKEAEAKAKNTNNYTDLGCKVFGLCKNTQV